MPSCRFGSDVCAQVSRRWHARQTGGRARRPPRSPHRPDRGGEAPLRVHGRMHAWRMPLSPNLGGSCGQHARRRGDVRLSAAGCRHHRADDSWRQCTGMPANTGMLAPTQCARDSMLCVHSSGACRLHVCSALLAGAPHSSRRHEPCPRAAEGAGSMPECTFTLCCALGSPRASTARLRVEGISRFCEKTAWMCRGVSWARSRDRSRQPPIRYLQPLHAWGRSPGSSHASTSWS